MLDLDAAEIAAQAAPVRAIRHYVVAIVKDRDTGDPVPIALHDDSGPFTGEIVNEFTGATEEWAFAGGAIASIGRIRRVSDISVHTVDVALSPLSSIANQMVRLYDARFAPIQILRGYHNPDTLELLAPAKARFRGWIDEAPIHFGKEGEPASITLKCASHTRELRRVNPDVRSHDSQLLRAPGDNFYRYVGTIGEREVPWGETAKKVTGSKGGRQGLWGVSDG